MSQMKSQTPSLILTDLISSKIVLRAIYLQLEELKVTLMLDVFKSTHSGKLREEPDMRDKLQLICRCQAMIIRATMMKVSAREA